ncbi:hypothetical protein [Pontibacter ruber]|uniref:Uncharacterized protein n=1 Tax=Pontibacter ruber TaxID=1343895 RepID=A0ABW5D1U7_9BACT|nr:hypothetical protein [Pontibacter ruber]
MAQISILLLLLLSLFGITKPGKNTSARKAEHALVPEAALTFVQDTAQTQQESQKKKTKKKDKAKKPKTPKAASVLMKRDVLNATLSKKGEDYNRVEVVIMGSGAPIRNPDDLQLLGNSGSPVTAGSYMGFDQINLPFEGTVRFKAPNKLNTVVYDREVRFAVNEPGYWVLKIDL